MIGRTVNRLADVGLILLGLCVLLVAFTFAFAGIGVWLDSRITQPPSAQAATTASSNSPAVTAKEYSQLYEGSSTFGVMSGVHAALRAAL